MVTIFGVWKDAGGRLSSRSDTAEDVGVAAAVAREWVEDGGAEVVTVSRDVEGMGEMVLMRVRAAAAAVRMAA